MDSIIHRRAAMAAPFVSRAAPIRQTNRSRSPTVSFLLAATLATILPGRADAADERFWGDDFISQFFAHYWPYILIAVVIIFVVAQIQKRRRRT
jgi:hypothetical protein